MSNQAVENERLGEAAPENKRIGTAVSANVILRPVTLADLELIYEWANDPVTRLNSINQNTITLEEHKKWFNAKLDNSDVHMYILEDMGKPVGQVRIDVANNAGEISYSIAPNHRGRGYGKSIIALAEKEAQSIPIKELEAVVKKDNVPSQQVFIKNGWNFIGEQGDLLIYKKNCVI